MLPIVDQFERAHRNLRISVTDRCNIRCLYCMPENVKFLPHRDVLTFEEITTVGPNPGSTWCPLGTRLTGGEPLLRAQLSSLVSMLKSIPGVQELAMTTNGVLLPQHAEDLKRAGLDRINISLDTVDDASLPPDYSSRLLGSGIRPELNRRSKPDSTTSDSMPFRLPMLSDQDIVQLAKFAKRQRLELRFIEFMPLDADQNWDRQQVRSGQQLRELIAANVGLLEPVAGRGSQPASNYRYVDDGLEVGFIDSVTAPFCAACDRMRITAEGKFRNCLFSAAEWDLKSALRFGSDQQVEAIVREAIAAKKAGHGTDSGEFLRPQRAMYQIGG